MSTVIENQAKTVSERRGLATAGLLPAVVIIVVGLLGVLLFLGGIPTQDGLLIVVAVVLLLGSAFAGVGLYMLQPNQAAVLTFFGDYRGTDRSPGLRWTNPLFRRRKISLRVRNFNTTTSKVNDAVSGLEARLTSKGAVWMVRDAVTQLEHGATDEDAIPLDPDRRATFAANLMTVIASDAPTSPVVNVGTLAR